jgi:hypothetical protein
MVYPAGRRVSDDPVHLDQFTMPSRIVVDKTTRPHVVIEVNPF